MNRTRISVAIIGEGETEWFYFDSLRRSKRYSFSIEPDLPQHADIGHMMKLVHNAVVSQYDYVFCLIDMDRINANAKERNLYNTYRQKRMYKDVIFIESMPCIEFWFLLHFLEHCSAKPYADCNAVLHDLRKYFKGYEKTKAFFKRHSLYDYLAANGDLERAKRHAKQLTEQHCSEPENNMLPYSEIYLILERLEEIMEQTNINLIK